jgi:hypothetical protein
MIALLSSTALAPALAQDKGPPTARSDLEKKQDAAIDKAYRDAIKRTDGAPQKPADPWQTVRPTASDNTKR